VAAADLLAADEEAIMTTTAPGTAIWTGYDKGPRTALYPFFRKPFWAQELLETLGGNANMIYDRLGCWSDFDSGIVSVGIKQLADQVNLATNTVRKELKRMERFGLIEIAEPGQPGRSYSKRYRVISEPPEGFKSRIVRVHFTNERVQTATKKGSNDDASTLFITDYTERADSEPENQTDPYQDIRNQRTGKIDLNTLAKCTERKAIARVLKGDQKRWREIPLSVANTKTLWEEGGNDDR